LTAADVGIEPNPEVETTPPNPDARYDAVTVPNPEADDAPDIARATESATDPAPPTEDMPEIEDDELILLALNAVVFNAVVLKTPTTILTLSPGQARRRSAFVLLFVGISTVKVPEVTVWTPPKLPIYAARLPLVALYILHPDVENVAPVQDGLTAGVVYAAVPLVVGVVLFAAVMS
jgi:hypothetical protein